MRKSILIVFSIVLLCGCVESTTPHISLYESYGINEANIRSPESVAKLVDLSKNGDFQTKGSAFDTLLSLKPWTPEIAQALSDYSMSEMNVRGKLKVAEYLVRAKMGKYALKPLMVLLSSNNGGVRARSAKMLGMIGEGAAEALPALRVVAENDAMKIERVAKNSIRQIELGRMINWN